MNILEIAVIYLLIINLFAFILMGADKRKARLHKWRIPEKTLFLSAILGGSIGAMLGMTFFRHKTKHLTFVLGMPAIFLAQLALFFYFAFPH